LRKVLVTGSKGFIGKNLMVSLLRQENVKVAGFDADDDVSLLREGLKDVGIIYHLAGVNRPGKVEEFETGHAGFTQQMLSLLSEQDRKPAIVLSSSIQAELDNPYGVSKKKVEDLLFDYSKNTGAPVFIHRLPNVFGKWCRPNYNSVVATFCYNIAHDLPITISDRETLIELVYIDDVIASFLEVLHKSERRPLEKYLSVRPAYKIKLGELADRIYQLRDIRKTLVVPDLKESFIRCLYATYLSYLEKDDFSYPLDLKTDSRGSLAEVIKSEHFGQMFVSKSHAGVIRGSHYHDTKIEKFCVIKGRAVIKLRHILEDKVLSYHVSGDKIEIVDIPPGYTHSIENLSDEEMIVLFWADQLFNSEKPDTYQNDA
jgi:UDP-2-acetamido-2,6-beta-L-arabino-hexul-4-ose reductase